ncbi:hypothetical protein [Nocardia sp. XZ_19_385]|uniref:hypothetical protein n=1 Tax=Nocardia sp. XZ_19_385 TaxID=2769488 RepID=UPI00188F8BFF|nr:hypothetical protein [Nocardia sp. XZ_19_385]
MLLISGVTAFLAGGAPGAFRRFARGPFSYGSERDRAAAAAFRRVFGRDPQSPTDWQTAHALNPKSYDPKNKDVDAEIKVVKIRPVPGKGSARVGQYIEQRDVTGGPDGSREMGDNRTADPNFDPEQTRVATVVDYENGIVVMRQNPSVRENSDGSPGEVRVDPPEGRVWQADDGAVRVQYEAGNPFAPSAAQDPPGGLSAWTVNGDLVFTPGSNGITVDGVRTDYPSMEVYQTLPEGSIRTVLVDPATSGSSLGPALNLPKHHDIGSGSKAFQQFMDWNLEYDVPNAIPKPSTEFGNPANPPGVPPIPGMI